MLEVRHADAGWRLAEGMCFLVVDCHALQLRRPVADIVDVHGPHSGMLEPGVRARRLIAVVSPRVLGA
jgi:hypothetical protein